MAFTDFPNVTDSTRLQDPDWFYQMTKSLDEATAAAGNGFHPPTTTIWDGNAMPGGGISIVSNRIHLVDTTKEWEIYDAEDNEWKKRWVNWTNPDISSDARFPGFYDLILIKLYGGQWDYRDIFRAFIVDQNLIDNGDGSFSSNELITVEVDFDAPGQQPLSYYTHYFIIRTDGAFPDNRVLDWPCDPFLEWAIPYVYSDPSKNTVRIPKSQRHWSIDQWKGKYLYGYFDGKVRSVVIDGNDYDGDFHVIHFAAQSHAIDTAAAIAIYNDPNKYWRQDHMSKVPDGEVASKADGPITIWARFGEAHNDSYYSRLPEDSKGIQPMTFPNGGFVIPDVRSSDDDVTVDIVNPDEFSVWGTDCDLFSLNVDTKDPPDWCFTMPYHKTIRSWINRMWNICSSFVPYDAGFYEGHNKYVINPLTVPRLMWDAGHSAAHGTTGDLIRDGGGTVIGIEVSMLSTQTIEDEFLPMIGRMSMERQTHWECITPDEGGDCVWTASTERWNKGQNLFRDVEAVWDGGDTLTLTSGTFSEDHQNQEIWFSWQLPRYVPNRMRYPFYERTCFIPDADDTGLAATVPPTEDAPGDWSQTRPKSTELIDYSDYGILDDPFSGTEYNNAQPSEGMLIRYMGDCYDDPTTSFQPGLLGQPFEVEYYDHYYEGKHDSQPNYPANYDYYEGTISVIDDDLQFGDEGQHYWDDGVLIGEGDSAHTGTLSVFTTTTITDSSHAGSAFWDGSRGRWVGHWVKILQPGEKANGPLHNTWRPITAYSAGGLTITFPAIKGLEATYQYLGYDDDLHTGNTTYAIVEPKWTMNFFKDAIVELIRGDTAKRIFSTVTYNSDNRIRITGWMDKDKDGESVNYTPVIGDQFRIRRNSTGTTWLYTGGELVKPPLGSYPDEQWVIPPTCRKRYGRLMNNDYVNNQYFQIIYDVRGQLRMRQFDVCFTAHPDGVTASDNNKSWAISHPTDCGVDCSPFADDTTSFSGDTCNPTAMSDGQTACTIGYNRSCGYAQLDLEKGCTDTFSEANQRQRLDSVAKFLTYGEIALGGGGRAGDDIPDEGEDNGLEDWTFDANGDEVLYRQWHVFDSVSGHTIHRTSVQFGSLALPNNAPQPCPGDGYIDHFQGYVVRKAKAIVDYGDGMTFI